MVAAGMLGALVAVGASWSLIPGDEPAVAAPFSFEVVLPATIVGDNSRGELAITPDGSRLVYVGPPTGGEAPELYVHQIGQQFDTPLQGSAGGTGPFLSPDGQSIGFVEGGSTIKQMPIGGGAPITLGTLPAGTYGASWTADDGIIVGTFERNDGGLYRLAAGGGEPEPLSTLDAGRNEMGHIWPFAVPDTDVVLFAAMTSAGGQSTELAAFSIDTGDISYLGIPGTSPRYVETGHLLYATVDGTGQVLAVPFDPQTLDVGNSPVPVLEGVNVHATSAAADFDVSNAGHLVAVSRSGVPSRPRTLTWVDRDGREESLTLDAGNYIAVQLSPDESQVALQELRNGTYDILAWHLARENLIRVTTDPGDDINPTWTPDGQHILFTSNRNRLRNVFMKAANGTGDVDQLTQGESQHHVDSTTPDGAIALYYANGTLRSVSLERPFDSETLLDGLEGRTNALPSSDGQWLALQERVSDRAEVFLRPWPNVRGDREPVSQGGGEQVVWSADGDELFYLSEDHLMARPIANGVPTGPEEQLFEVGSYYRGLHHSFDVAADGRFLMISEEDVADGFESEPLVTFDFTLNWFEVLEERVPLP